MKMYLIVPKNSSKEDCIKDIPLIYENAGGGEVVNISWTSQEAELNLKSYNHGQDIYEIRVFAVTQIED